MKKIFIYIMLLVTIFGYSYFLGPNISDEIWNYGFSYNISHGLVIYRDFNVLQTPLLFFCGSIFISIFGHHLWSVHIFNSIILLTLFIVLYKSIGKKSLIIIPLILLYCLYSYSLLCLLFVIIILSIDERDFRYKDCIISFLVSLIFLTKQNIGICMIIPMFLYSKNKKKSLISFFIPIFVLFIYLIYYDCVYEFIDCCFLGMLDFGNNNSYISYLTLLWLVSAIYFGINLFKSKFGDRKALYILMFHVICIPIFDWYHFIFVVILFLYYVLYKYDYQEYKNKYFVIMSFVFYLISFITNYSFNICNDKNSFMYGRNVTYSYFYGLENIKKYIVDNSDVYGDNIYIFSDNAYLIKLELGIDINNYDFILNGNMGYKGYKKRIVNLENICGNSLCMFILDKDEMGVQINTNMRDYVISSYSFYEDIDSYKIYGNGGIFDD